ncbi:hypothetical protein AJ78_08999 [Emergomyces pasteurianus Ep9510]|uniref:Uncharacterized protein n=1 Tax=Emergomyces pasteurianus Ep9510 TaxID=1447872 RepID=A0A1J9PP68_9EURO|nr:hypothetical protein AJ78_08999 [Emergomyces pasteurianus Ep9510]
MTVETSDSTEVITISLSTESKRLKASLPDPAHYNSNNSFYFLQFLSNLKVKIIIDEQAIENEQAQMCLQAESLEQTE